MAEEHAQSGFWSSEIPSLRFPACDSEALKNIRARTAHTELCKQTTREGSFINFSSGSLLQLLIIFNCSNSLFAKLFRSEHHSPALPNALCPATQFPANQIDRLAGVSSECRVCFDFENQKGEFNSITSGSLNSSIAIIGRRRRETKLVSMNSVPANVNKNR